MGASGATARGAIKVSYIFDVLATQVTHTEKHQKLYRKDAKHETHFS